MMLQQAIENAKNSDSHAVPTSSHALFVVPHGREDGFRASIRGHILDLADPNSGHGLAPTPEDLFIASIASELAWSARRFLRARGLPDFVSVSAKWQTPEERPILVEIDLTLTVSKRAEAASAVLAAVFANGLATRSLAEPVAHVSLEGISR
jgi:putative redox protein